MATKEFKLIGKITSLRVADDGAVVRCGIATNGGYSTTRHHRFLRPLAAEHDPQVIKQNNKNVSKSSTLGKIEIPTNLDVQTDDDIADSTEQYVEKPQAGPRRSSHIKHKPDKIRTVRT